MTELQQLRAIAALIADSAQDFSELIVKLDQCEECSGQGIAKITAAGPDPVCPVCHGMGVRP